MESRDLLVKEFSTGIAVAVAQALGPDSSVNDSDDDVFARSNSALIACGAAKLAPQTAGSTKSQEGRGRVRIGLHQLVRGYFENAILLLERCRLTSCQFGGKTVITNGVIVNL